MPEPAPAAPFRRRHVGARTRAVLVAALLTAGLAVAVLGGPTDAGAEARPVLVSVIPEPELPVAGEDVTARVRITGCIPGTPDVELYLTTDDGEFETSTLMAETTAKTSLLWEQRAELTIPAAFEGWYGARVRCGTFDPPTGAMPGTSFRVDSAVDNTPVVAEDELTVGGTLTLSGIDCAGPRVEYDVQQNGLRSAPFTVEDEFPVNADGTWGGTVELEQTINAGSVRVLSRCVATNQYGNEVYVYFPPVVEVPVVG